LAIIGSGISGLVAARLLVADHDIHVFEANSYAGGHTNTVSFTAFGRQYAADTGFMVL
jgi:predicted NAD/FAD-binding protein